MSTTRVGKTYIHSNRGRQYTSVDVDYWPPLHGPLARDAAGLVLAGAEETLDAGRRTRFWIGVGPTMADITRGTARIMLDHLRENADEVSGSLFRTLVPNDAAAGYVEAFAAIARKREDAAR